MQRRQRPAAAAGANPAVSASQSGQPCAIVGLSSNPCVGCTFTCGRPRGGGAAQQSGMGGCRRPRSSRRHPAPLPGGCTAQPAPGGVQQGGWQVGCGAWRLAEQSKRSSWGGRRSRARLARLGGRLSCNSTDAALHSAPPLPHQSLASQKLCCSTHLQISCVPHVPNPLWLESHRLNHRRSVSLPLCRPREHQRQALAGDAAAVGRRHVLHSHRVERLAVSGGEGRRV